MDKTLQLLILNYLQENRSIQKNEILLSIADYYHKWNLPFLAYLCLCKLFIEHYNIDELENLTKFCILDSGNNKNKFQLQNTQCTLSVIIPTFNRPGELRVAIKSVLQQEFNDFEIIVVNDCGSDMTDDVILSFNNNKIKYIKLPKNKGLPGARNAGILKAVGKYVAYLDDDDIYYNCHLQTAVDYLENNPIADAVYTEAWWSYGHSENGKFKESRRESLRRRPKSFDRKRLFENNYISTLSFVHKRECFNKIGLFNEELPKLEDWDFLLRFARHFNIKQINKKTGEYRWKDDNMSVIAHDELTFMSMILRSYYETDCGRLLLAHYYHINKQVQEYNGLMDLIASEQDTCYFMSARGINKLIEVVNSKNSCKFKRWFDDFFEYDAIKCLKTVYSCHLYIEILRLSFNKNMAKKILRRLKKYIGKA